MAPYNGLELHSLQKFAICDVVNLLTEGFCCGQTDPPQN